MLARTHAHLVEFDDRTVSLSVFGVLVKDEESALICFDLLHMLSSCSQPGLEDIGHPQNQVLIEAQFRQDPKSPASNFVLGHILLCTDLWLKYKKLNNT